MLTAGKSTAISFKVNILGTQASAQTVKVILGTTPELSFAARHISEQDWIADVEAPEQLAGSYDLRIEVLVNNRLFTPLTTKVEIVAADSATATPAPEEVPAEKPVPVEVPASAVAPPQVSIIKRFEEDQLKAKIAALPDIVKLKRKFEVLSSGLPTPSKTPPEKLNPIKLADIVASVQNTQIEESKSSAQPKVTSTVKVKTSSGLVKLVKGDISYE